MILTKKQNNKYLLVKINTSDWKYLRGFRKHELPRHVKAMDKYLERVVSLHIKAIFVYTAALMLEAEKKITKKKSGAITHDLNKTLFGYVKTIDKHFKKIDRIMD
jgi:hypothetical protein